MRKLIPFALGFVVIYNLLFFQTDTGIGTGLFFLFFNIFYYLFRNNQARNINLAIIFSSVSTTFGFLTGWRSNEILQLMNLATAVLSSLIALYFYKSENIFSFEIPKFILTPLISVAGSLAGFFSIFVSQQETSEKTHSETTKALFRGIAIAFPIFMILLILLTQADPVFSKIVENIFEDIWERILVSLVILAGLLSFGLTKIKEIITNTENKKEVNHKTYELLVIVGSLVFLLGSFMLVEFRYFFSNVRERELHQLGITSLTYSEYVKKGFFELLGASVIASTVIAYVMRYLHSLPSPQKMWIQILSSSLIIEIALLILSAMQRINLYQAQHGLTRARVFGFLFLIWLISLLVITLVRIFKEFKKEIIFGSALSVTFIFLLTINVLNIDGLIATKYRPSVNKEIDYYYLTHLSADSYASWEDAILDAKNTLQKLEPIKTFSGEDYRQLYYARLSLERLNYEIAYLNYKYSPQIETANLDKEMLKNLTKLRKWQSFILGEKDAYDLIKSKQEIFKQLPDLLRTANDFDALRVSDDVRLNAPIDRVTEPPLL